MQPHNQKQITVVKNVKIKNTQKWQPVT